MANATIPTQLKGFDYQEYDTEFATDVSLCMSEITHIILAVRHYGHTVV